MTAPVLEMERVAVSLGAFALRDISLALAPAEILVLMGANGAGKSVLLETIAGFHAAAVGRISIAGRDATRLRRNSGASASWCRTTACFPI